MKENSVGIIATLEHKIKEQLAKKSNSEDSTRLEMLSKL